MKPRLVIVNVVLRMTVPVIRVLSRIFLSNSFFGQVHPRSRVVSPTTAALPSATTIFVKPTSTAATPTPANPTATTPTEDQTTLFVNRYRNSRKTRPCWRSAQQIFYRMDKNFQQLIRQHYHSTRLPHSFSHITTRHHNTNTYNTILQRTSPTHRSGCSEFTSKSSYRTSLASTSSGNSRILQLPICYPQEG